MLFSYRKALYAAVTLFWLVMTGMLLQRHYGIFHLSGHTSGRALQSAFTAPDTEEQWMGVYQNGEKVGYVSRKISPVPGGYSMREAFRMKMIVMGAVKEIEMLLDAGLDRKMKLLSFTARIKADLDLEISGKVSGRDVSLTIDSSGVKTTKTLRLSKEPTLDPAMTGMLKGLKPGDKLSVPVFEPALAGFADIEMTVAAEEKIMSLGKLRDAFRVSGSMNGSDFTVWISLEGEVLREESAMGLLLVKESREDALKFGSPSLDLISQAAVPIRMKLPRGISWIKIRISGIDFTGLELQGGRQKLKGDVLEISREVTGPDTKRAHTPMKGRGFDDYLGDTVFIQSKDPQIAALAKEIVKDERNPLVAARLIYDWVYRTIEKTPTITLPMAVDVLKAKKGDCNEHTTLFVALARAAGIPAKTAVGLAHKDGFYYYHAWPEFYAGQWIAADPTLGQFPADASHIRLATGELDKQVRMLAVINKIRIEVLEYR